MNGQFSRSFFFFFVFLLLRFYTPLWYGLCTLLLWWKSTCVPETISVEIFCDGFTILQVLSSLIFTVPLIDPHLYTLFYNFIIYYSVFLLIFVSEIYTTGFVEREFRGDDINHGLSIYWELTTVMLVHESRQVLIDFNFPWI